MMASRFDPTVSIQGGLGLQLQIMEGNHDCDLQVKG